MGDMSYIYKRFNEMKKEKIEYRQKKNFQKLKEILDKRGIPILPESDISTLKFMYKGSIVYYYTKADTARGKTIKPCKTIASLLIQLV